MQRPGIYLHEIQRELENLLLLDISISTICRFLHDKGVGKEGAKGALAPPDFDLIQILYCILLLVVSLKTYFLPA